MTDQKLTLEGLAAKPLSNRGKQMGARGRKFAAVAAILGSSVLSGCITVNAPTEPIVIELNINITAEVIYRLAEDAGNTIDENADIF